MGAKSTTTSNHPSTPPGQVRTKLLATLLCLKNINSQLVFSIKRNIVLPNHRMTFLTQKSVQRGLLRASGGVTLSIVTLGTIRPGAARNATEFQH